MQTPPTGPRPTPTAPPLPAAPAPGALDQALLAERLRLYRTHVRLAAAGQWSGGLLLAAVMWGHVPPSSLLGWLAALTLVLAVRLAWGWHDGRRAPDEQPRARLQRTRVLAVASGLVWGAAGALLAPPDLPLQTFQVFVLAGMAAGALTLFAFDLATALAYTASALLPLALRLLTEGDRAGLGMGLMVLMFVGYLVIIGRRGQQVLLEHLATRLAEAGRTEALLRQQAELQALSTQLARKTEALELTLASMDQGIVSLDAQGRVQVFNQRLCELTDVPADFLARGPTMAEVTELQLARGHYDRSLEVVDDKVARRRLQGWLGGENVGLPPSYQRRTPSGLVLEVKTRELPDGGLVRTFTDVTAAVEAQAQTRKLATVAAHTDDAVAITDPARQVEWVNEAFTRLTGFGLGDVRGTQLVDHVAGPETDGREVARLVHDALGGGRGKGELKLYDRERRARWIDTEVHAVHEPGGALLQLVFIGRDVTARRQAEAELRAARDDAERASRAKSEFLSSMSHELRTPLNAILGFAQLLERDDAQPLPPRQVDQVQQIRRAGEHLLALISDVLDLASVEAGRQPIKTAAVPLAPLVDDCLQMMRPAAQARGIVLHVERGAGDVTVAADRKRLRQVLLNLLSNAVKYNREQGEVQVSLSAAAGHGTVAVQDTGPGLAPAQLQRLFMPFERLGAAGGPVEGAGIGLALSRRLAELMQGTLEVDSVPGQGSCFRIRLPLAAWPDGRGDAAPAAPSPPPGATASQPARRCTVLYIEDNPVNAALLAAMVERVPGATLAIAAWPEDGLAMARADRPDLVLLDILLPGMDGYEVLARLRADPATRALRVVAVTANAMPDDIARALAAGFDGYLTKPLDLEPVLAVVRATLHD